MIPKFKIRCSQIGKIMAGSIGLSDREKSELDALLNRDKPYTDNMEKRYNELLYKLDNPMLSAGAQTYCKKWLKEKLFKRRKEINSKYLDKGNICEDWSIDFVNAYLLEQNFKNEEYFENEFLTGTPDIINDGIDDIKNSYDFDTFPLCEFEPPNMDYVYQLNGYMHLLGKKKGRIIYTLNNSPYHMIEKEAKSLAYRKGGGWGDYMSDLVAHHTYDEIDDEFKIKIFNIEYDEQLMIEVEKRVELCQLYINELTEKIYEAK